MTRLTKETIPEIAEDERITITTEGVEFAGTVENVQDNGHSMAYTLDVDGKTCKMYADVRCVELLAENESHFVSEITIE